ncbi:MAG: alpha/beta fold hydrolase [Burkholderiaceae bacterium]|nr:alpha/beta fold hydrolase [Burkholderiaceae bacterium]
MRCRRERRWPAVLAGAVLLCAAGAAAPADAIAPLLQPCRLDGLAQAARCGVVKRALDPARPQGVQIEVHFAVVPALARRKADDPVFFFAGGPGQSAIELAGLLASRYARLNQRRDLVFVDQRGTGRSAPLKCADDDERAVLQPLAERIDEARQQARLRECRLALQALPQGDLRFYTTELATGDVLAVRQALGGARINAIGASYGSRAVLDLLRQQPQAVRRAVLDGVVPPDMRLADSAARDNQAALDALLDACAAEAACAHRHPALRAQWRSLLAALPQPVALPHPVSGRTETVLLRRDTLLSLVRAPLYAPLLASALPAAIAEAADGRWAPLAALAGSLGGSAGTVYTGMHLSVVCSEDLGPVPLPADSAGDAPDAAAGNDFGATFAQQYRQACADWPRGAVSAAFFSLPPLPAAGAPVWLLSGGLDPVTPPRHGQRVAQALGPRARHIVVPQLGHGVTALGCLRDAVVRFIDTADDAGALAGDAGCAAAVPRPLAFVPPGAAADGASR